MFFFIGEFDVAKKNVRGVDRRGTGLFLREKRRHCLGPWSLTQHGVRIWQWVEN